MLPDHAVWRFLRAHSHGLAGEGSCQPYLDGAVVRRQYPARREPRQRGGKLRVPGQIALGEELLHSTDGGDEPGHSVRPTAKQEVVNRLVNLPPERRKAGGRLRPLKAGNETIHVLQKGIQFAHEVGLAPILHREAAG